MDYVFSLTHGLYIQPRGFPYGRAWALIIQIVEKHCQIAQLLHQDLRIIRAQSFYGVVCKSRGQCIPEYVKPVVSGLRASYILHPAMKYAHLV